MLSSLIHLCLPIIASAPLLVSVGRDSKDKEEVIGEVLRIQKSLIAPLETEPKASLAKTGFLTIQMDRAYLEEFLEEGELILAYDGSQIVGYLLLQPVEEYFTWLKKQQLDTDWYLGSLKETKYIDQIAILPSYSRRGIGTVLIVEAKKRSPGGLLTDVLLEPYPNPASLSFFDSCGFTKAGLIKVQASDKRPGHKIAMMLWMP